MASNKVFSSSAFKSRHDLEVEKLRTLKLIELVHNLRTSLQNEEFADVKINVGNQFTCFQKCITFALAPDIISGVVIGEEVQIDFCPDKVTENADISYLALIYNPDESTINDSQVISKVGSKLQELLSSDATKSFSDVTFQLDDGELFHCHKSIVSSRSDFFKAMLYGSWRESNKEVVKISSIEQNVFKSLLDYIYFANPVLQEEVDIVGVMLAQDMLGIHGFHDVIKHHLRMYYFHNFHQPCDTCIVHITRMYNFLLQSQLLGYEDLVKSCDHCFSKYFAKILTNKNLLKIPTNIREFIVEVTTGSINHINVIGFIKDCMKAKATLPNVKWAVEASMLLTKIEDFYHKLVCGNFRDVTIQAGFAIIFLEENNKHISKMIFEIIEISLKKYMTVENSLDIYMQLVYLQNCIDKVYSSENDQKDLSHSQDFVDNCKGLAKEFIRKNFVKIQRTKIWKDLDEHHKEELTSKSGFIFH